MRVAAVVTALGLVVAGCSAGPASPHGAPRADGAGASAAAALDGTTQAPTTGVPTHEGSHVQAGPFTVSSTRLEGRTGPTTWSMLLPEVAGPLAVQVQRRVRRSADEGVSRLAQGAPEDKASSVEVTGEVTRNDGRTLQVRLDFLFYAHGAPHPLKEVSTVVLRRRDASPVLLTDVLADPAPALGETLRLAAQVASQEGREDPTGQLSTDVEDWADWQASPDGLTFYFDDHQAGGYAAGLRDVDVPWRLARRHVRDDAYELLGPA